MNIPSPSAAAMYALIDGQGTACAETALCSEHMTPENQELVTRITQRAYGTSGRDAADMETGFVDCSGNEVLSCQMCGATLH